MTESANPEKELLERLAFASLKEQRKQRRWGIFFKAFYLFFALAFTWTLLPVDAFTMKSHVKPHTALIDIKSEIADDAPANADDIATSLNLAFKDQNTQGIILRINSPGGSPVQAAYIYDEIRRLQKKYPKIKVYAVCTDLCTSAAYYIAASADQIYANPASLVGSIGVLMNGFGFVDTLHKLGIERRLLTAGRNKSFLDPFSPIKKEDEDHLKIMLDQIHEQFINSVKKARGNRLKDDPDLFSGLVWTGEQAKDLGLIDAFGSAGYVAREVIKNENIIDYTIKPSYMELIANKVGATFAHEVESELTTPTSTLR